MGSLTFVLRSAILASSALHAIGQSLGTGISSPSVTGPYNNFTSHSTDLQTSTSSDESSSTPVTLSDDPTTVTSSLSQPASNASTAVDTAPTESSSLVEISAGVVPSSSSSVMASSSSSSASSSALETASNTTAVQLSSTSSSIPLSSTSSSLTSSTSYSESPSTTSSGSFTAIITATDSETRTTITSAPSTTIAPTGSQASSSESALHTQLSSVIPVIQSWIDDDTDDIDPIISSLDDIEDETNELLSEIPDVSDKDTDHGCTANLFSLLTCIVDDVVSIKGSITEGVVEEVTSQLEDLTDLTDELENQEDDDDDDESSSTTSSQASTESSITSSTSSSTSSCSSGTSVTEDYFVTCSPTVISSTTTQTCETSTSTVSGCSVSATASTTTISSSAHPQCAQTGCSACTETTLSKPTASCADCVTTVSGRAYPAEQTSIPEGAEEITSLEDLANNTSSKRKRTLVTPADFDGNYLDFFTAQLQDPSLVNVPHRPAGTGGSSSALVQLYLDYPFSMTVQGLYGCTSVVLISRRGVYMSHLFENPGFSDNFQNDIAQAIPNGDATPMSIGSVFDGQPWCPDLRAQSAAGGTFDPNQEGGVKTILVTPGPYISDTTTNVYRYPNEINVIRTWLSNTFGSEPSDHVYTSTDNFMSNNQGVSFGKVLFQYDPNQAIAFENKILHDGQTYRCPVKYAGVKLWSGFQQDFLGNDMDPFYEMNWPTQVYDPAGSVPGYQQDGQQKRDEVPAACTLVEDEGSSTSSASSSTGTPSSAAETSSGASSSPSSTAAISTSASSSSALSTVPYSAPLTLSTLASPTASSTPIIATTSIGSYQCKYINHDTAPELGCGIAPFWQCLGSTTTLYLPGSATPSGSTLASDQTMPEPTYTGTATGADACSSTVSPSSSSSKTTSSSASKPTYTGTCDTDTSRALYGQCVWDDGSGIYQAGDCSSTAACPGNDSPCYIVDFGTSANITCGEGTLTSSSSTTSSASSGSSSSSSTSSCIVPGGCENVSADEGGCDILCA